MRYIESLNVIFSDDQGLSQVINEVAMIPASELDRILHQGELRRVIVQSSKGDIQDAWNKFFTAIDKKNKNQMKTSLSKLIVGYSLVIQFLSQPQNERMNWIKTFLNRVNTKDKEKKTK